MSRSEPAPSSRLVARIVLVAAGLLGALLLLEVALRVTSLNNDFRSSAVDVVRQHRRPGPDHRLRRFAITKSPGRFRILAIGDSFAWGSGVLQEDAFPDRIQTFWNLRHRDQPIEVVNWSRPGWNTAQEWKSLQGQLKPLDPDLLIIGFVLNDAEPLQLERRERLQAGRQRRHPETVLSRWLYSHSRAYNLLFEGVGNLRQSRAVETYYHSLYGKDGGWQAHLSALTRFRDWAHQRSVPMLLVIFPVFNTEVDAGYPHRDLHLLVARDAEALGIEVLDLLPAYQGMDTRRLAVVPFIDGHPNEIAHRIAAERIITRLVDEGWLPPARVDLLAGGSGTAAESD